MAESTVEMDDLKGTLRVDSFDDEKYSSFHKSNEITETIYDEQVNEDINGIVEKDTWSKKWTRIVKKVHVPIMKSILFFTKIASKYPKQTICAVTLLSFSLVVIGLFTNFNVDVDEDVLWTPMQSKPIQYMNWIQDDSNYPTEPRYFVLFFHSNGENVLGYDQVQKVFQAVDVVRNQTKYHDICSKYGNYVGDVATNVESNRTCSIHGIVEFWNSSTSIFEARSLSDDDVVKSMSATTYPDGTPVPTDSIIGYVERNESDNTLSYAKSYTVAIALPEIDDEASIIEAEDDFVDAVLALNSIWMASGNSTFQVTVQAESSFGNEFSRAILSDIPLIPIVFIIMSIFTCTVFWKYDRVESRTLLGFLAVCSVFLSIMSGYGLLFIIGTPFTSMTQILPFVVFGIGLDDTYIIMGSYLRTDRSKSPEERVRITMEDIGISITLTSLTTIVAFALGCSSSIPAVRWLCLYASPTVAFVYIYQITFVVAFIILDERRITARKRDCCFCIKAKHLETGEDMNHSGSNGQVEFNNKEEDKLTTMDRVMILYAETLLRPISKVIVLVSASVIFGLCAWSTTKLTQEFKFTDVLPSDSYVTDFTLASDEYSQRSFLELGVYFRNVDQSDESIRAQMEQYVADLVGMDSITSQPDRFWVRDFNGFINESSTLRELDFSQQLTAFLNNSVYYDQYKDDIVLDNAGMITTSRCFLNIDNVDFQDVKVQVNAMDEQLEVTKQQPINNGMEDYVFFNYDGIHNIWQFYSQSVYELTLNTVIGVASVTILAFLLIPHWSAAVFVLPITCVLYVDILGFMQWLGVHINAVSYVAMVMSIGLVVDFIMHVLLRYYECHGNRREKTIELLRTMGSSVLVGGISTFLGTLPLAFSTSQIFTTIFITFLALVLFGVTHGLVVMPVLLSMLGPEEQVTTSMVAVHQKPPSNERSRQDLDGKSLRKESELSSDEIEL
jgi:Niemann-Pick C1 protein